MGGAQHGCMDQVLDAPVLWQGRGSKSRDELISIRRETLTHWKIASCMQSCGAVPQRRSEVLNCSI
jgi:hypothetical protein